MVIYSYTYIFLYMYIFIHFQFQLPLFTVLSFCFVVPPILKRIVNEKETGVKVRYTKILFLYYDSFFIVFLIMSKINSSRLINKLSLISFLVFLYFLLKIF